MPCGEGKPSAHLVQQLECLMRPRHINARELAARRVQIGFHIRVQALLRRARHGGILLRAVGKHGHEAEIARALVQLVEEQLDNIEVAV